jgi:hypothetical protein
MKMLLNILDDVPSGEHTLMQDAADEDAFFVRSINDDMAFVLNPAISSPNPVARPPDARGSGQLPKAAFQSIDITFGLRQTPCIECVVGNFDQVEPGQPREPVFGQ